MPNQMLKISSDEGKPMCNLAISMQSQQDELTIGLCHMEGAVPGSHGLRAVGETVVPRPIPILWLVFSPVTRGVCGHAWLSLERQQSQPAPVGFTLMHLHLPPAWVRQQGPNHPASLRARDSFWPIEFCDYFFPSSQISLTLALSILFHNFSWFFSFFFLNLICFVLNWEVLGTDLLSQKPSVLFTCRTLSSCFPSPSPERGGEVRGGDQPCALWRKPTVDAEFQPHLRLTLAYF